MYLALCILLAKPIEIELIRKTYFASTKAKYFEEASEEEMQNEEENKTTNRFSYATVNMERFIFR